MKYFLILLLTNTALAQDCNLIKEAYNVGCLNGIYHLMFTKDGKVRLKIPLKLRQEIVQYCEDSSIIIKNVCSTEIKK